MDNEVGMPTVRWSADVGQADWIGGRLGPFGSGEVTSIVPAGFEAYARILHPAHDSAERPDRWSEVAARNGITLRRDAHFPQIALLPPGDSHQSWDGVGPQEGTLSAAGAAALIKVLRQHTTSADQCWFCLWDGYGWETAASGSTSFLSDPIPDRVREGPRVELPGREYFLYQGGLESALAFVESQQQTSNLWWPADQAWCLASELDLGWTYVAGPQHLIDDLLGDSRVEALPARPPITTSCDSHRGWCMPSTVRYPVLWRATRVMCRPSWAR